MAHVDSAAPPAAGLWLPSASWVVPAYLALNHRQRHLDTGR